MHGNSSRPLVPSIKQYPLAFPLEESLAAEDYIITPCNQLLADQLLHSSEPVILLSGAAKTGKTHLLHWLSKQRPTQTISANDIGKTPAESWLQKDHCYLIDNAETITNEAALAQAINLARALPAQLVIAVNHPPANTPFQLRDLISRLKAAFHLTMPAPDEMLLGAVLHKYLADLQWRCTSDVSHYIITRLPRDMVTLQAFVAQANLHALAEKRALTIPFAATILKQVAHAS